MTSDLTIVPVVQDAEQNYPVIHLSEQELNAAVANIRLARSSYLPRVDGIAQFNGAMRNNVFGTLLLQSILPSISGPGHRNEQWWLGMGERGGAFDQLAAIRLGMRYAKVEAAAAGHDRVVITSLNGRSHWINVRKGPAIGENVSIRGRLAAGQEVVKRASDEIREETLLAK